MRRKILCFISLVVCLFPLTVFAQTVQWDSQIEMTPQSPKADDNVIFQVSVKASQDEKDLKIVGVLDNKEVFSRTFSELKAGKSRSIRFRWTAQAGDHTIYFKIITSTQLKTSKISSKITSSRKTRDPLQVSKTFSVTGSEIGLPQAGSFSMTAQESTLISVKQPVCEGRPLPDLEVEGLTVYGSGQPGQEHEIAVTVANTGQCDSGVFAVRLEVLIQVPAKDIYETKEVGIKPVKSLKTCSTASCTDTSETVYFKYTILNENNAYYDFTVEVDPYGDVEEFNEKNNKRERDGEIRVEIYN